MAVRNMVSAYKFFGSIAAVSALFYVLQITENNEFLINSDILLATAIISGVIAIWTFFA